MESRRTLPTLGVPRLPEWRACIRDKYPMAAGNLRECVSVCVCNNYHCYDFWLVLGKHHMNNQLELFCQSHMGSRSE